MVNVKIQNWLEKLDIKLQESFAESLKKLAQEFQKEHNIKNIEQIYSLFGIKNNTLPIGNNIHTVHKQRPKKI